VYYFGGAPSPLPRSLVIFSHVCRAVPDTISARFGNIGNRIGKAETLPIFADIVTAKLKPYRYDIGKYRAVTDIRTDIPLL
jgi:hypothetical protein